VGAMSGSPKSKTPENYYVQRILNNRVGFGPAVQARFVVFSLCSPYHELTAVKFIS
jgi:hypothetical protein